MEEAQRLLAFLLLPLTLISKMTLTLSSRLTIQSCCRGVWWNRNWILTEKAREIDGTWRLSPIGNIPPESPSLYYITVLHEIYWVPLFHLPIFSFLCASSMHPRRLWHLQFLLSPPSWTIMVFNTISVGTAVTPTVIETYISHVWLEDISSQRFLSHSTRSTSTESLCIKSPLPTFRITKAWISSANSLITLPIILSKIYRPLHLNGFPVHAGSKLKKSPYLKNAYLKLQTRS